MKKLKRVYTFLVLVLIVGAVVLFNGCQNEEQESNPNPNWEYLDFDSDFTGEGYLAEKDLEVLLTAGERVGYYTTQEGFTYIMNSSARQINVSERVLLYILRSLENGNELVMRSSGEINIAPITKNGSESSQKNDCVARCIAYLGGSYDDAWSYTQRNYGSGGVPSDKIGSMMKHFFTNSISVSTLNSSNYNNTLVVIEGTHAAICVGISNGYVYCYDPQIGAHYTVHHTRISAAYKK